MKRFYFCFFSFLIIFIVSFFLPGYFSAADLLQNIPSFHTGNFIPPKNSLLADPVMQFEPWRQFAKNSFSKGEIPIWNPDNAGGVPLLANPQTALFYPLTLLYYLLPIQVGLYALHFFKLFFIGFFTYLYLRILKRSRKVSVLGSCIVAFSGFSIVWLQWPHTNVFLFFPLILYLTEKILRENKKNNRNYAMLTFAYFLAILGGHPETLFHILLIHSAYVIARLHSQKKKILLIFLSICFSFLLASFLILPFLEYLQMSTAFASRKGTSVNFYLSPMGILQFIFPFLGGAPHLPFYRSLNQETNFQEGIGGYVGSVVFVLAILGFIKNRADAVVRFWAILSALIFLLIFNVWPLTMINQLPIFSLSINVRLIGFLVFGFVVSFSYSLDKILKIGVSKNNKFKFILISLLATSALAFLISLITPSLLIQFPNKISQFFSFVFIHIAFILTTTSIFLSALFFYKKYPKLSFVFIFLALLSQTFLLFIKYNPQITKDYFYPETEMIEVLKKFPKAPIIEVGNLNFPENINLIYNLQHAFSYDALGIANHDSVLNTVARNKSKWGRLSEPNLHEIESLGIKYIVSDYDIRLKKKNLHGNPQEIITNKNEILATFSIAEKADSIQGFRFMFVTYNRTNNCKVVLNIFDKATAVLVYSKSISCSLMSNYMYFTFPVIQNVLKENTSYEVKLNLKNYDALNIVSLVGEKGVASVDILSNRTPQKSNLDLLWQKDSLFLFALPVDPLLRMDGTYEVLRKSNTDLVIKTNSNRKQNVVVYKSYYPGWIVTIDSNPVNILNKNSYMSFDLEEGEHVVAITYQSSIIMLGTCLSLFFLFIFLTYIVRTEVQQQYFKIGFKNMKAQLFSISEIPIIVHVFYVSIASVCGLILYFLIFTLLLPKSLPLSSTTSINWLTVNNHSLSLDYLRFGLFVLVQFCSILTGWVFLLWRRIK